MILTELLPHQTYLLDQAIKNGTRNAVWAAAGIGKSLVALAYADRLKVERILVTCDRQNINKTWPVEVGVHTDFNVVDPERGRYRGRDLIPETNLPTVVLCSHDWLKYHVEEVNAFGPYDLWIGDESADYKNPRTLRMEALRKVLAYIPKRMILSAFPVSERLEDVFGQFLCLDDGQTLGAYITHFRQRFMLPDPCSDWGWVPKANAVDSIRRLVAPFLVALPDDMHPQMPERIYHTHYLPLHPEAGHAYEQIRKKFALTLSDRTISLTTASAQFNKLFEICNGFMYETEKDHREKSAILFGCNKIAKVKELVDSYPGKSVIWTHFTEEQDILGNELDVTCWKYRGGKTGLEPFLAHKGKSCLLISCNYAKGLNQLAKIGQVITYSMPWAYITLAQADMRTCRITGSTPTVYHRLVTQDTVDEKIYNLIMAKAEFTQSVDRFRAMLD